MKAPYTSLHLVSSIAKSIPDDVLESSLTHSSLSICLVAFSSIEAVVPTYYSADVSPLELLEKEVSYWRQAMPYACKSGSKEFNKELLLILSSLLNRLSDVESACFSDCLDDSNAPAQGLPILTSFVCDFLITEVIVQQGAYPGTVADKEGFVLALFQCILSFACQDGAALEPARPRVKPGGRCRKSPRVIEVTSMRSILMYLLAAEPMSALFSLLHSMWDNTRDAAFTCLCDLVQQAHARGLLLPDRFALPKSVGYNQARSLHLASSPRQREADTGSKILAFICAAFKSEEERRDHNMCTLTLLLGRLDIMADVLGVKLKPSGIHFAATDDSLLGDGTKIPMAHGLMVAIRLTVESKSILLGKNDAFYERFVMVCCRALQLSLSVVADLKEGATLAEEEWSHQEERSHSTTAPLNVNTGAIGANAGFSSIQRTDDDETMRSYAFQRIIVRESVILHHV